MTAGTTCGTSSCPATGSIPIQNASFSQANAFVQGCGSPPVCNYGPIPGWSSTGQYTGSWQPDSNSYNPLPGIVAYSNGGTISQVLSATVQPNTTYTLQVDIGHRLDGSQIAGYTIALGAGSNPLATSDDSNGELVAGAFQTETVTYTSGANPPSGNLAIVLASYGDQIDFKNVALTTSAPSPPATVNYYFADHLGSASVVTDAAGAIQEESDYYPFGGERIVTDSGVGNNYKFTGKERDAETGLDNFGKRYFGSSLGRFQTPDPVTISWRRMVNPQLWNAYSYVGNNPLSFVDPTGEELVQLGQHTDDEIKKRKKEIGQELKNKDLTKEQKNALKNERNTLNLEQQGNHVVGNLLAKLDQTGQRNGLQLSNFTLSTDTKNDFAGAATPAAMQKLLNDQAFVIQNNKQFGGTIYIRTEPETGFYQMSQSNSDFGYYGASAISHEQVHLNGGGEYPAYQRQLGVFEGFHNFFQNQDLYRGLDESIRDGIKANQPQ